MTHPDAPQLHPTPRFSVGLLWPVLLLAGPVVVEQLLHTVVGATDTYLANHLILADELSPQQKSAALAENASAAAAVGTVTYVLWLVGLVSTAVGAGATALIARATGARHRSLANAVCGQSIAAAAVAGIALGTLFWLIAPWVAGRVNLSPDAQAYLISYMRWLAPSMPLAIVMFVAGSCLRGAGDTISPAIAMVTVDVANILLSVGMVRGRFGLPELGFEGIAIGTAIAYCVGGLMLVGVLMFGPGRATLHLHRLRLQWQTLRRVLRIGLPNGIEGSLQWLANFAVLWAVNGLNGRSDIPAAAHLNTIRIESFSFLTGMAFAVAASTLVGQNLGARNTLAARHSAYAAYALGGGVMACFGLLFILAGEQLAALITPDPQVQQLTARCLFVAGFVQPMFGAAMIFGGALRGAGDTLRVMLLNLLSIFFVRMMVVLAAIYFFDIGLVGIWIILSVELSLRGLMMWLRFRFGQWYLIKV